MSARTAVVCGLAESDHYGRKDQSLLPRKLSGMTITIAAA
jgi:hypothetical protein